VLGNELPSSCCVRQNAPSLVEAGPGLDLYSPISKPLYAVVYVRESFRRDDFDWARRNLHVTAAFTGWHFRREDEEAQ
jgi:hypothetical protein